jgi:signal transduction protein with GAF and PtsI domain
VDIDKDLPEKFEVAQSKLRTLINISKYINSNIELEKLLNIIIKTSLDLVDSEESSLMLLDKNNDRLIFYSVSGSNETILNQFSFPADQGIAGEVIKKGVPIIIDDVQSDQDISTKSIKN